VQEWSLCFLKLFAGKRCSGLVFCPDLRSLDHWKILGEVNFFLYRYCGGQFLKPLSLGAVNLSLKHLVVKKIKSKKTKQNK
jgi:hypothetical protein